MGFSLIKQVLNHRDLILRKLVAAQIQEDQLGQCVDYSDDPIEWTHVIVGDVEVSQLLTHLNAF